ncbi:MAG: hypothetical protein ABI591_25540 [Kofleriaceae bacterium]
MTTQGADANLVISPLTAACSACHDAPAAIAHMTANGGQFYVARSIVRAAPPEQCMTYHGPGRVAAIGAVH